MLFYVSVLLMRRRARFVKPRSPFFGEIRVQACASEYECVCLCMPVLWMGRSLNLPLSCLFVEALECECASPLTRPCTSVY